MLKQNPLTREPVKGRRAHDGVTRTAQRAVSLLVAKDEDDIGPIHVEFLSCERLGDGCPGRFPRRYYATSDGLEPRIKTGQKKRTSMSPDYALG